MVLIQRNHHALLRTGLNLNRQEAVLYLGREYVEIENGYKGIRHAKYVKPVLASIDMEKCNQAMTAAGA